MKDLEWHLELPVWTTVPGEPRFDLAPREVLRSPDDHHRRYARIRSVDLSYQLDLFKNGDRWVIVDGYHRLARHWLDESTEVPVRMHGDECWEAVVNA